MPQDAFTLYHAAKELSSALTGGKINKVSQPDKDEIYLLTYSHIGSRTLVVSSNAQNARISFTDTEKPNPAAALNFCMLLRKHLLGAEIKDISLVGFERIVKITFTNSNEFKENVNKELYAEIMGKYSNIILTENEKILGCLKNAPLDVATKRMLLTGMKYTLPESQEKTEISDKKTSIAVLQKFDGEDLADFLFKNFKGLCALTASEAASLVNNETVKGNEETVYGILYGFILNPPVKPNVTADGKHSDFYICDYKTITCPKKYFDNIYDAEDSFYSSKEKNKLFAEKSKQLSDVVKLHEKKLQKKLQTVLEKELACGNMETLKIKGELLTSNLYRLKNGSESCELENYYDENQSKIKVELDKNLTINQNAQRYFKKYGKDKKTLEAVEPQKKEITEELDYLQSVSDELSQATDVNDFTEIEEELKSLNYIKKEITKKITKPAEQPYRIFTLDGFNIKAGKNNVQNDRLTGRAQKTDLWLHTKGFHSSHVIIESAGAEFPDKVIQTAAEICAYFSQAKNGSKVPVDYTLKKFVKKPPAAKPGSVIYTDYKTCYVNPNPHEELKKQ